MQTRNGRNYTKRPEGFPSDRFIFSQTFGTVKWALEIVDPDKSDL
jgi:hypothetical protein